MNLLSRKKKDFVMPSNDQVGKYCASLKFEYGESGDRAFESYSLKKLKLVSTSWANAIEIWLKSRQKFDGYTYYLRFNRIFRESPKIKLKTERNPFCRKLASKFIWIKKKPKEGMVDKIV